MSDFHEGLTVDEDPPTREGRLVLTGPTGRATTAQGGKVMVIGAPRHRNTCGHQRGTLVCESQPHPDHPNGHVYVSDAGSHVADRHGGAS